MAAAALPEFLPASGKFTATSGILKYKIDKRGVFECKQSKATGEITGGKKFTATLDLEQCTFGSFGNMKTSGDGSGTVLIPIDGQLCFLKSTSPLEVGADVTILPESGVTIEIPTVGLKLAITGLAIAAVTPINSSSLLANLSFKLKETEGLQLLKKCEGGKETEFKISENGGAFLPLGMEYNLAITYAALTEVMG